ncbi:MAG: HupE/UreJ family protein [Granulosicoccus sp.]
MRFWNFTHWTVLLGLLVVLSTASLNASAHTLRPAVATIVLDDAGSVSVEIKTNVEALIIGIGTEHSDTDHSPKSEAYDKLRALTSTQLVSEFDGFAAQFLSDLRVETEDGKLKLELIEVMVPEPGDLELSRDSLITLKGNIKPAAQQITWHWPELYGSSVVRLSTPTSEEPLTSWLPAGQVSDPLPITGLNEAVDKTKVIIDYLIYGFTHILPYGLDHILFVIGLCLLSMKLRPLLWQISAFTLAHTITLGLSIHGLINIPSSIVEPLIALSIAYIGIENCLLSKMNSWRIVIVFLFGLLHGMGFAGVLGDIGLSANAFVTALISFNIGVELGQLTIIGLVFIVTLAIRQRSWYRSRVVIPCSLVLSIVGLYWTFERVLL